MTSGLEEDIRDDKSKVELSILKTWLLKSQKASKNSGYRSLMAFKRTTWYSGLSNFIIRIKYERTAED